ncbi:MAG: squalene/phytoene synthase family protein [Magnetococcus sp. YQC-5]
MKTPDPIPAYLTNDFGYCRAIARQREEALPIRFQFVTRGVRPFLHAIYAFMWTAYDFTGLPGRDDDFKLQLLDDWSRRLSLAKTGHPDHPIFRAMAYTFIATGLPESLLQELLIAFRMDITNKNHETIEDLKEYCHFSANSLGRMILHVCQEVDLNTVGMMSDKIPDSDAFWTAMQWTVFWQNLGQDSRSGRPIYLPKDAMARFGVTEEMIWQRRFTPMLGNLILSLVNETRILFASGEPLLAKIGWPLRLELTTAMERGMTLLDCIEACGGNTFRTRPTLTQRERLGCVWRAFGRASAFGRGT